MTAEILCGACIGAFLTFAFFLNLSKGDGGDAKKDHAIEIMEGGLKTYARIADALERIEAKMEKKP